MVRETEVQSKVESYQRLKKWYFIPPCLTLSIITYVSRVKWSNPEKGVVPSLTPRCSSYWKGSLRVAFESPSSCLWVAFELPLSRLRVAFEYSHQFLLGRKYCDWLENILCWRLFTDWFFHCWIDQQLNHDINFMQEITNILLISKSSSENHFVTLM